MFAKNIEERKAASKKKKKKKKKKEGQSYLVVSELKAWSKKILR
jgi:hypothetical protein